MTALLLTVLLTLTVWSAVGLLLLAHHTGPHALARTAVAMSAFLTSLAAIAALYLL